MSNELYWVDRDGQGMMAGGQHDSESDAQAASEGWLSELISQCCSTEERQWILDGHFEWNGFK